jgi:P27 family predicted phage terminase small subunit
MKKALNTYRADRGKSSPEFTPSHGAKTPIYLRSNRLAASEWRCVVTELEAAGVLKEIDWALLGNYCVTYSGWREAAADVEKNGQVVWIESSTRTGMTRKPIPNPSQERNQLQLGSAKDSPRLIVPVSRQRSPMRTTRSCDSSTT